MTANPTLAPLLLAALALVAGAPASGAGAAPRAELRLEPLASGVDASLRGLSVLDQRVAWASGSDGWVGVTTDAGAHWRFRRVPGLEGRDFRDVEAFSAERALLLAVGSPGLILETTDGGASWSERFRDERPEVFLDGLDCDGTGRCLAFGDPSDGRFLLVASADAGRSWTRLEGPAALPGEAGFAASGSSIRFAPEGAVAIGTGGGETARLLLSEDGGGSWRAEPTPLAAGSASRGLFSLAPRQGGGWVAVGGDHLAPDERAGTAGFRAARDPMLRPAEAPPGGYRSGVEPLADGRLIATGPNGTDLSEDGGRTWEPLAEAGYHAVARARRGTLVLLAGADGRMARLKAAGR